MSTPEPFSGWAIVELMGHRRRAGAVSQVEMFGSQLLRIDVPIADAKLFDGAQCVTEFYGGSAIYALRPCSEEVARAVAVSLGDVRPIAPAAFRLTGPDRAEAPDDYPEEYEGED